jgi:hypothetical protein
MELNRGMVSPKSSPRNHLNHNSCSPRVPHAGGVRARHDARFIRDWRAHCRPIDRNTRVRLIYLAEALERRTKPAGRPRGQLGYIGLQILRALLFAFMNHGTGLLCPSYRALQEKTGFCRQSIAQGLARLERAGILRIARRLCRQWVERINPVTGEPERYLGTTQTTSLYSVHEPSAWADHLVMPAGRRAPFPSLRQMSLLQRMELTWKTRLQLSPLRREKPLTRGAHAVGDVLAAGFQRA